MLLQDQRVINSGNKKCGSAEVKHLKNLPHSLAEAGFLFSVPSFPNVCKFPISVGKFTTITEVRINKEPAICSPVSFSL